MKTETFYPDLLVIPFKLIRDKNLDQVDRMLYGVIYWYQHLKDGRCFASNEKMADILGTTARVVQNSLTSLEKAGYIKRIYKDSKKRNRLEIKGLIAFGRVSPTGDREKTSDPQMTNVSPIDDTTSDPQVTRVIIGNKNNEKEYNTAETSSADVVSVIDIFEEVNPSFKKWYGNKTQRGAIDRLVVTHGLPKILQVVPWLKKTNGMSYFPTITTPLQLEDKWAGLESAFIRYKSGKNIKKANIAFT